MIESPATNGSEPLFAVIVIYPEVFSLRALGYVASLVELEEEPFVTTALPIVAGNELELEPPSALAIVSHADTEYTARMVMSPVTLNS